MDKTRTEELELSRSLLPRALGPVPEEAQALPPAEKGEKTFLEKSGVCMLCLVCVLSVCAKCVCLVCVLGVCA